MPLRPTLCCLLLACAPGLGLAQAGAPAPSLTNIAEVTEVTSVASVDLARYSGTWYEIAAYPMFFQRNCTGDTTAEYSPAEGGALRVLNRCKTDTGFVQASGTATVVPGYGNSRLLVSFFWPFTAHYWVLGLDADYRWAVVGHPQRKYLWLLSRTPQLEPALLEAALASARAQGFDLAPLRYTPQSGTP